MILSSCNLLLIIFLFYQKIKINIDRNAYIIRYLTDKLLYNKYRLFRSKLFDKMSILNNLIEFSSLVRL